MASNFAIAFRVLPRERRLAIESVYDFCRRADDAVDDAPNVAAGKTALELVRAQLDAALAGDDRVIPGLASAVSRFELPRRPFDDLLEGVGWDLEGRRYATREALREYCYRVASTVGLLCVRIFGCGRGVCDAYAEHLGVALQWTNILRDIRPDLESGRLYLPAASLSGHDLRADDLAQPRAEDRARIAALIRDEAAYARRCFAAAQSALPDAERSRVVSGQIMAGVYQALLGKIERLGDRVLDKRVRVSSARRSWLAVRAVLGARAAVLEAR